MYVQGIAIFCAIYCTVDMFSCVYSVLYTIIVQLKDNKMHNFCITEFLHRFSTACPISFVQFLWYTHSYKWTRLLGHSVYIIYVRLLLGIKRGKMNAKKEEEKHLISFFLFLLNFNGVLRLWVNSCFYFTK